MKKVQIEKYAIRCLPKSWLAKPGMVIYIEKDYNQAANDTVCLNIKELKYFSGCVGMQFIYLPLFLNKCDRDLSIYMTGRNVGSSSHILNGVPLESVLGYEVFGQIKVPSIFYWNK